MDICPLIPKIRLRSSALNPFITDITMINVATPRAIPVNAKPVITEIKPSFLLARK